MTVARITRRNLVKGAAATALAVPAAASAAEPARVKELERRLRTRYVTNEGVRLHYEIAGSGPLVLFAHGFPGWWWTWRHPMAALVDRYTVAALDMRGYNLSDKPTGVGQYTVAKLIGDLRAVIQHTGAERATVVGHDWGGGTAWGLALASPELVQRLVAVNIPHPWALARELHSNPRQQVASRYAQVLRRPDAASQPLPEQFAALLPGQTHFTPEVLALILSQRDLLDYPQHLAAMRRTSIQGALDYYAANWAAEPYPDPGPPFQIDVPTLVIFGREDPFLLADGLDGTWDLVKPSLRMDVIAGAQHFVQNDARDTFIRTLAEWLHRTDRHTARARGKTAAA